MKVMQGNGDYVSPPTVREIRATERAGKPESPRTRNYKEHTGQVEKAGGISLPATKAKSYKMAQGRVSECISE